MFYILIIIFTIGFNQFHKSNLRVVRSINEYTTFVLKGTTSIALGTIDNFFKIQQLEIVGVKVSRSVV